MSYGTNIRVSEEIHKQLIKHLDRKIKIGAWTDEAIIEKIDRERIEKVRANLPPSEVENRKH